MVERRGAELLEPELGGSSSMREVGDPTVDELPSLCVALKRARLLAGYDLKDAASALRIRLLYIEALEEGRFEDLPGMTYAVGFLRSYSEYLGLDSEEMIDRLKSEKAPGITQRQLSFPVPPQEGGTPKPLLILAVLVLAGLAYGGWRVYSTDGQIATDLVSNVSTTFTEATGISGDEDVMAAVASETTGAGKASLSEPAVAEPAAAVEIESPEIQPEEAVFSADTGSNSVSGSSSVRQESDEIAAENSAIAVEAEVNAVIANDVAAPVVQPEAATPITETAPQRSDSLWDSAVENQPDETLAVPAANSSGSGETMPLVSNANAQDLNGAADSEQFNIASASPEAPVYEPKVFGEENTNFRIAIMATADSWVQIQGPNNELLLTRILRTGDIYQVPNRSGLIMVTGNAGALEVRVDGAVVGALGPIGVVRRNVALDPEVLAAGTDTSR
jgi:cytoskeleton protein RodZ